MNFSKLNFKLIFPIICLISLTICHSTKYPGVYRNETCYKPEPAKIYSWHFHVLYWQTNEDHTKGAFQLRDKFFETFKHKLGPTCKDLFHQDYMCMFDPDEQPVGPFLTAQWSVFFLNDDFTTLVPWIMQHRGNYDVLVHPNSGCEVEDHTWWAFWGGNPWEINLDAFSLDYPFPWPKKGQTKQEILDNSEASELLKTFLVEHES